jgi:hypothetical protein
VTKNKKMEEMQVVRVTESHDCHGVRIPKGAVGYVYPGETYGVLKENEVAVTFTFLADLKFLGVDESKIESFTGDIATMSARAAGFEKLEFRLRDIQQKWASRGKVRVANVVLDMRKHFHVESLVTLLGWDTSEAEDDFLRSETLLKKLKAKPYQTRAESNKA